MPGFWVWRVGVNTLIANWRWRDYLLAFGGRRYRLFPIVVSGWVLALGNNLLRRVGRTSE